MAKKQKRNKSYTAKKSTPTQANTVSPNTVALLNQMQSFSVPRGMFPTQTATVDSINRDTEFFQRNEMYKDSFTRGMAQVILGRSIGASNNESIPFNLILDDKELLPQKDQDIITEEFAHLEKIINKSLFEVAMDSMFFGDGYSKIVMEEGKGITALLTNFTTKAPNITPIVSNKGQEIAYEVGASRLYKTKTDAGTAGNRHYVTNSTVARLNAKSNGSYTLLTEQVINFSEMSLFTDKEMYYEDGIYGGIVEDSYEDFKQYKWSLKALSNARIASAVLERFITHTLGSISNDEKIVLQNALEHQIHSTVKALGDRIKDKDPMPLIANHIIPTVGEDVNAVNIQESSPNIQGLDTIEDIMLHIKTYVSGIGFPMELTAFGGNVQGGGEKDSSFGQSLLMEEIGSNLRESIREYITNIVVLHFKAKFNLDIEDKVQIEFNNILNASKLKAEMQRMEAVSNSQQFLGIVEQLKAMKFEDTPETRELLKEEIKTIINQSYTNSQDIINSYIDYILTPAPKEEEGF